jgi:hypothetical protein
MLEIKRDTEPMKENTIIVDDDTKAFVDSFLRIHLEEIIPSTHYGYFQKLNARAQAEEEETEEKRETKAA